MKRRTFLNRTVLASCFSMMPAPWLADRTDSFRHLAHPELLQLLDDPDAVAAIGDAYLASSTHTHSTTSLSDMLERRLGLIRLQPLPDVIAMRVKQDFATGHTCQLNGWILAETEAMQCALFSLTRA